MIDRHLTPGKERCVPQDVPASQQEAAERIRSHLVRLRGGAPFLSPTDASALVAWLDAGVPEARILRGLEEAAKKRRAQRKRSRLELRHAKKWLGRPRGRPDLSAPVAMEEHSHPLGAITATLLGPHPEGAPSLESRRELIGTLTGFTTEDHDELAAQAIEAIGLWFEKCYAALTDAERAAWEDLAADELGDVLDILAEHEVDEIVEEHARGLFRDTCGVVNATTILQLLG